MPQRNLIILSRFEILEHTQHLNALVPAPSYRMVTADPPEQSAAEIRWERPLLHAQVRLSGGAVLHVINLHLKSRIPTDIPGQKVNDFTWKSASAWAEGAFIAMMRRVGQALEARRLVDQLFDADENALIAVCGDLNADSELLHDESIAFATDELHPESDHSPVIAEFQMMGA
ncbi:endonuclease/exonuclease/phosphatase family protein [Archangium lansingense]|uniref:endonuclease/exonuclease/phosphatase family protein n=1 Tax=Archangium lansingense TaxID=2995310 RepID=UPI003B7A454F